MFIVTNREVLPRKSGAKMLGSKLNPRGPHELRLAEAVPSGKSWKVEILPDRLTAADRTRLGVTDDHIEFGSQYAAHKLISRVRTRKRHLLFFVHGYNNNCEAVLKRAHAFEKAFGVEVVAFSWPANGGGLRGVASYKSDKRDARASAVALDRTLTKMHKLLADANDRLHGDIIDHIRDKFENDEEKRDNYVSQAMAKGCPYTLNMVLHSMGNYLYKQLLTSSVFEGNKLIFDNVVLAAADTNNAGHEKWVDKIECRKRIYIAMNEDDGALMASRVKSGEEQKARLGHYPHNLTSSKAVYVNFTDAPRVGKSHAYFEGNCLRNSVIKKFFKAAFTGKRAEDGLIYDAANAMYRVKLGGKS